MESKAVRLSVGVGLDAYRSKTVLHSDWYWFDNAIELPTFVRSYSTIVSSVSPIVALVSKPPKP